MLVLLADDDTDLLDLVSYAIRKDGHKVVTASSGRDALRVAEAQRPDMAILDVMMPPPDGFEVCRQLRDNRPIPVILLTARGEESNKVWGLDLGADDYVTKPFSTKELLARVRAIARRSGALQRPQRGVLASGRLRMDLDRHEVWSGERPVDLTPREYEMLYRLLISPNSVVSHEELFEFVWGADSDVELASVKVYIRHLREKLERDPSTPELLLSVRGVGYKLRA
jgi:DNA-binding response OmpR family regulator